MKAFRTKWAIKLEWRMLQMGGASRALGKVPRRRPMVLVSTDATPTGAFFIRSSKKSAAE